MIDITIGDRTIEVEMKTYYLDYAAKTYNAAELTKVLADIIEKVKYSGETISLWQVRGYQKILIKEWH